MKIEQSSAAVSSGEAPRAAFEDRCIHQVFERQVRRSPQAVAINCGAERLTYQQLDEESNRLAQFLRQQGVGPETPVALRLERSTAMVVAILAVLKAGGAYVPIDLAYPRERVEFMLEDCQAPVLLTQQKLLESLPPAKARAFCLDSDHGQVFGQPSSAPADLARPDNAAYIIYTSGSTGKPKGVTVTHRNVVRLLQQTEPWYGFNAADVWPWFHSYAFDVSVWELWGALFYGGRLAVVPYLTSRSPADFYEFLDIEQATVLNQTPSAFRQLIWAETTAAARRPLKLRYVICAGEALELQSLRPWFEIHGDRQPQIVNMYGITEITVHATYRVIRQSDLDGGLGSVIGAPIPDLQIHLVDEQLKPVPPGMPGEICVGGAGVARGYLNRPELTRQRFIPDPFCRQAGATLYRSGDLARQGASGELEYLGRMDHQVKIRGFRVELGEIESALNGHGAIRESVVLALDRPEGDKRLVAYLVASGAPPTVTELREHLTQRLPDYMVPAAFVFLESLPLTTNGKVDRRALPNPDGARPELRQPYQAPRNAAEALLAEIWGQALGLKQVGVGDNFFELGGDSIRAIVILSRAQRRGLRFSLAELFDCPTIAALASRAEARDLSRLSAGTQPFQLVSAADREELPPDIEDAYPLTRLQIGMFYFNELNPASAIYHDVFSYRIEARWDRERLELAAQRLVARHPLMRTSFHLAGFSEALQLVHKDSRVPFTVEDLRGKAPAEQDRALADWVEVEKRRPFDRAQAPLMRLHSQVRTDGEFQFMISFHHACMDGWSLAAAVAELFRDYARLLENVDQPIAAPALAYRDFMALELQSMASEPSRKFWSEKLAGAESQLLPRWPGNYCAGGLEQKRGPEIILDESVLSGIKELARRAGVPLKAVLLAAHLRVLALLHGSSEVTAGLISNGRPEETDGEKLIGLFLNTLPLRLQLAGGTWMELVRQTFAAEREILPHRRFPLAEIQKLQGGAPLFETAFDFVHFHVLKELADQPALGFAEGQYFEANNLTTYTTFMLDPDSRRLELHLDYDPNSLCREQIEAISAYYVNTLHAMASDPCGHYETFSPLSEAESSRLLVDWNQTATDYPRNACIHELFEARAKAAPDSVAVICNGKRLTYRQLDAQSTCLATHLLGLGVGPETLVALCLERSVELLVALLGILKAGGAYVPIDPAYPEERIGFMLEDSSPRVLLTQRRFLDLFASVRPQLVCLEDVDLERRAPALRVPDANHIEPAPSPAAPTPLSRDAHRAPTAPSPDNLAYVIFTSGSTGRPKAVQVAHRSVVNLLTSVAQTAQVDAKDNLLAVTTLSFDIAALELFLPLTTGGTVTLADRETAGDGTRLAGLLESSGATVLQGTPATWRLLLESGWKGTAGLKAFCGGEALPRELADDLLRRTAGLWNFYGPTETTIWSSVWKVTSGEPISIGRPLANTQWYILDCALNPVPAGTVGDLYIGGLGVTRGYLNRPELMAEKFIANPFSKAAGRRLYRTGDRARFLPDGRAECLGRSDDQVKIRGFRIELGEIEAALRQNAGIVNAVVAAVPDASGEKRLAAYFVSRDNPPAAAELREFLKTKLPAYMMPAHFLPLAELPLTPNGKIDRRSLPVPEESVSIAAAFVGPRNADEELLSRIWSEVLAVKLLGIDDNLFEAGADSISATRGFARINAALGLELTLQDVFDYPTIRALGEVVRMNRGKSVSTYSAIPRRSQQPEPP